MTLEDLDELIGYAREQLGLGDDRPWRLLSSSIKMKKTFFEVEETRPEGARLLVGKVADSEKSKGAFDSLRTLRDAGLRPPSPYRVVEPVAYFPDRHLLLQEKASGAMLFDKIKAATATTGDAERAAEWLLALQDIRVPGLRQGSLGNFERTRDELTLALPGCARRLRPITTFIGSHLAAETPGIASHGDYHPMNLYISDDYVTAIDVDTFAAREPMYDVAYFLAQSAIMGYPKFQSFAPTEELRAAFLEAYEKRAPRLYRKDRIRVFVAFAFLRSLHYDFCILRTDPHHLVEPFLSAAERALSEAHIRLAA
jgi:hypothetical protein